MCAVDFQCIRWGWVTDLVSSLWLARTHTLTHKAFLSETKSVYCGQGGYSFQTHGGDLTHHIQVIGWLLIIICQDQGDLFIG